jgi:hypothetical protein
MKFSQMQQNLTYRMVKLFLHLLVMAAALFCLSWSHKDRHRLEDLVHPPHEFVEKMMVMDLKEPVIFFILLDWPMSQFFIRILRLNWVELVDSLLWVDIWRFRYFFVGFGGLRVFRSCREGRDWDLLLLRTLQEAISLHMVRFVKHLKNVINSTDWLDIIHQISFQFKSQFEEAKYISEKQLIIKMYTKAGMANFI